MNNKFDFNKITMMYKEGKLTKNEWYLLSSLENKHYLNGFLTGSPEYKIYYDSSIPENLYFTNVEMVLNAFYSLFIKYPEYNFDSILYNALEEMSKNPYNIYEFLTLVATHVENEAKGISPFKINSVNLLKNCKENLKEYGEALSKNKSFRGINKPNGQMDVIKEYNEEFKNILQYDIFGVDDSQKKTK